MDMSQKFSMDSVPMVRHHLIGHEFHSCIPRISTSGEATQIKADGKAIAHLPRCNNLHAYDLPEKDRGFSRKEKESTSCVAEQTKTSWTNANQEESSRCNNAEKESYSLTPFYSLEKGASRKRLFTLLGMDDDDVTSASKFEESSAKYTPCLGRMEMDGIHGSSSAFNEKNPSSPRNFPLGFHGLSAFAVSKWRTDSNSIGKNREFVRVKKDYWVSHLHLEARSKDCDTALTSLNFLFPDNRKLEISNVCGFQHEERGNSLHLKGGMRKLMCLDSSDGEKVQTFMPSWAEKCVAGETMKTKLREEVCDGRGPKLPSESRRFEPCGAVDASPYYNHSSNLNWTEHPRLDRCNEHKDKERLTMDASTIDCHGLPSAGTDLIETGSLQSDSSSKGLTSWHVKKRARLDANEEGSKAISAPTSSQSNKAMEQDLLNTSKEGTHCCSSGCGCGCGCGWVKRLKVHPVGPFEPGTRSSMNHGGVKKLCTRVLNYSRSKCSISLASHLDHRRVEPWIGRPNSRVESLKRSHTWIRRWCHTHPPQCRQEETLSETLEGKHFPSIEAIALMGKAASSFRPCEFRRRGTSLVWNTEGF